MKPIQLAAFSAAFSAVLVLLPGCAGGKPDIYSGWYISADKGMKVSKTGPDAYLVLLKGKSGREMSLQTELSRNKLISEYGGGFSIARDSGVFYSVGNAESREQLQKTDSLGFAQWWKAIQEWAPSPSDSGSAAADPTTP